MTRTLCGVSLAAGLALLSASPVEGQEVPSSWSRYQGKFDYDSPEFQCSGRTGTRWMLSLEHGQVVERAASIHRLRDGRDPLPYDIEFSADMLAPLPPPPAIDGATGRPIKNHREAWARNYARMHARRIVVMVEDGWLLGFNAGEWGGSLWWFPSKPGPGVKLLDDNVRFLVRHPVSGAVIALVGLAHLMLDDGAVLVVERGPGGRWGARKVADLQSQPNAIGETPEGDLLVAATNTVARVGPGGQVTVLTTIEPPVGMPQSVLLAPSGDLFVGLRFFVLRLRRTQGGYEPEYYIPSGCARFRDADFDCVCEGGVPHWREMLKDRAGPPR